MEATNKSYLRFLHFKTQSWHKSHIHQRNNYSYTCVRIVVLTSKWRVMPKGIWNGHCFFDSHYPSITRTRQAWTYSPFLLFNLNKELLYGPGIFRRSLGLIRRRLHLRVTSQLPGLLHLPVKASALYFLHNNRHGLSCRWEWPAASACLPWRKFSVWDGAFEIRSRW